ncbi:hypothetical protein K438DRAFT_829236 [Mycena galopus ATCC 62051]|nr:hypothetical protein K438DRAFT_829236 [Mycena galopus ATCC 62051]
MISLSKLLYPTISLFLFLSYASHIPGGEPSRQHSLSGCLCQDGSLISKQISAKLTSKSECDRKTLSKDDENGTVSPVVGWWMVKKKEGRRLACGIAVNLNLLFSDTGRT